MASGFPLQGAVLLHYFKKFGGTFFWDWLNLRPNLGLLARTENIFL